MFLFTRIHAIPRLPKHSSMKCGKENGSQVLGERHEISVRVKASTVEQKRGFPFHRGLIKQAICQ
jgi:hypothetical protein